VKGPAERREAEAGQHDDHHDAKHQDDCRLSRKT
jgi:hypothetical protein